MDMRDISALYKLTDEVFSASGLDPKSADTTAFQRTVTKRAGGVSVQFVRRQHMLFNYEDTCQATWLLSHLFHRQEDRVDYPAIQDPVNTIATKFRITKRLPDGEQLSLKERIVACRFVERERTVLVWKATLTGEGSCAGMQTDETGWSVIRPSATGSGTIMEGCMRQDPAHLHTIVDPAVANRFDKFLQSIIQENSQEITNGAKAVLLENMLSGICA
ncbi:hypothetical protein PF005_g5491 [Phytophthora fragariae]|nr:hypothetical protein PF003_g22880 [Phytophthora fragariae]KAE8944321.1 hypothetical protein PF009_g6016 [Phytophthora fragariae]KAE9022434.1 hypothetical protein PF011_g4472 [Phytophthora fragariae]KAE9127626.1 hypothetical protein PF007_g5558 [Phytophthora fragariae]KAE9150973.1 hypothetical protein PF006_g4674 [Phytophthora fragariae]